MGRCSAQSNINYRSLILFHRKEMTRVKGKITAIECHVDYALCEFQTLHNETIRTTEDKLFDETSQSLAFEHWVRNHNLIIRGVKSSVKDERFKTPRVSQALV